MKVPVLFLDRDGIINLDKGFISKKQDFIFNNLIFETCKLFNFSQFKIVIIINQSGIGRGNIDIKNFQELNLFINMTNKITNSSTFLIINDLESSWVALISILIIGFGITNNYFIFLAEYFRRTFDTSRKRPVFK